MVRSFANHMTLQLSLGQYSSQNIIFETVFDIFLKYLFLSVQKDDNETGYKYQSFKAQNARKFESILELFIVTKFEMTRFELQGL